MTETNGTREEALSPTRRIPDLHGQAAILLVESLIHGLIARSVITVREAIEIVGDATDVREEIGSQHDEPADQLAKALAIFTSISTSLAPDLDAEPNDRIHNT